MSSNTENIEAKLCAYVDGDLDEHGKLEIEKHLQTNPQHRLLLEELKQTKSMMQALPREFAPPELAETIHGQLERSVLLDGVGTEDVAATMKINRWPQLMAVAAVLLLASGLGVLVYVVLPTPTNVAFDPASVRHDATEDGVARGPMASKTSSTELGAVASKDDAGARFPENVSLEANRDKESFAKAEAKTIGGGSGGGGSLTISGGAIDDKVVGNLGKAAEVSASSARRVLIVLKTDNVTETNGQVATYLDTNKISWSAAEPSARDTYLASRYRGTEVQLRENMKVAGVINNDQPLNNSLINNGTTGVGGNNNFNSNTDLNYNAGGSKVAAAKGNEDNVRNAYQVPQGGRAGNDRLQSQQQAMPNMQSGQQSQGQVASQTGGEQQQQLQDQQRQVKESLTLNQQTGEATAQNERRFNFDTVRNDNVIVARNLSREQAVMVVDSLGKLYAGQTAVVLDRDVLDEVPAKHLPKAEEVAVSSPTTLPGAVPAPVQPADADAKAKTDWSQASVQGSREELKKQLGELASTTQPSDNAPAVPTLAAATTRPVEGEAVTGVANKPAFTPGQAADLDLNRQATTTQPAEQPLEVVIVVQPAAAAGPVEMPAAPPGMPPNPAPQAEPPVTAAPTPAPTTQPDVVVEPAPAPAEMNQQAK